jgi:ribosomal-protein-alanine N-acetyltransferase
LLLGYEVRPLAGGDEAALAEAYTRNREHLAPWEPSRRPEFFTEPAQRADAEAKLAAAAAGPQDRG